MKVEHAAFVSCANTQLTALGENGGIGNSKGEHFFDLLSGRPWVRIPPGVRKIRQEQQNVENLADFSFSHSNFIFR